MYYTNNYQWKSSVRSDFRYYLMMTSYYSKYHEQMVSKIPKRFFTSTYCVYRHSLQMLNSSFSSTPSTIILKSHTQKPHALTPCRQPVINNLTLVFNIVVVKMNSYRLLPFIGPYQLEIYGSTQNRCTLLINSVALTLCPPLGITMVLNFGHNKKKNNA